MNIKVINKGLRVTAYILTLILLLSACTENKPEVDESVASVAETTEDESLVAEQSAESESFSKVESGEEISFEEESSEEESALPVNPYTPRIPLPETLETDAIDSYFNGSVFVGYSIMMHFGRYIGEWHSEIDPSIMGNPVFCAAPGISFYADRTQAPEDEKSTLPLFKGKRYNFKDLPAATGCNNMYIGLMGYSEVKRYGASGACRETVNGIKRVLEANPGLNLVILACTYNTGVYDEKLSEKLNNANIREYNQKVLEYCTENGIDFVDVATPLTTHNGYLPLSFATDGKYHIAKHAFYLWVEALRDYARQKQAGTWQNPAVLPEMPSAHLYDTL